MAPIYTVFEMISSGRNNANANNDGNAADLLVRSVYKNAIYIFTQTSRQTLLSFF